MKSDEVKAYIYIGGAVVVAYVAYRAVTGASRAAGAVGGAVASAAGAVDDGIAGVVGGVGGLFGLPTPDQTISDPKAVRYIIDTEGHMAASARGTAWAYAQAVLMPAGSGGSQVSADVLKRVASAPADIQLGLPSSESALDGPSFSSTRNQQWSYF